MLSGAIRCDKIRKYLWGRSTTESLNDIFLCSVDFVLVGFALLTWGLDCSSVSLIIIFLVLAPDTFAMSI